MNNFLTEYIEMHKGFCPDGLYKKLKDNMKPIEVVSYKSIPEIKDKVERLLHHSPAIPHHCYQNSAEACLEIEGVKYVEGIFGSILPISHAWNSYKGIYFDLTIEYNRLEEERMYLQLMDIEAQKLRRYLFELKYWGNFTTYHYTGVNSHFKIGI